MMDFLMWDVEATVKFLLEAVRLECISLGPMKNRMMTDRKAALESEKKGLKKQLETLSGEAAAKWRADIQNIEKEMKVVNFTDEEIVREMINEGEAVTMFKNLTKEGEPAQFCLDLQVPAFRKRTPQDVYVPRYWYLTKT